MRQVLQDLRKGRTWVADVPAPMPGRGQILVRTRCTLLSPGTERMMVEFSQGNLLQKARSQPDRVRDVLNKIKTDGLLPTLEAVFAKLSEPLPLGYCNVGVVAEAPDAATAERFPVGTRVVCNGHHADYVAVGSRMAAAIPDGVADEEASFTVLGAIGLQGIRLAAPTLGETVLVVGAGLIGLLTVQLLRAQGCEVLVADLLPERLRLAEEFGAKALRCPPGELGAAAVAATRGRGVDVALLTVATDSDEPLRQAARACRPRGRIVLVGVAGLQVDRTEFYRKELSFQVSCSYGPGRYDDAFERGADYPIGHVRWTAERNFEAVLTLLRDGRLRVGPLLQRAFDASQAAEAYGLLVREPKTLGILLRFSEAQDASKVPPRVVRRRAGEAASKGLVCSAVGAGNFARRVLIPEFSRAGFTWSTIVSARGVSAAVAAEKHSARRAATDPAEALTDAAAGAVLIATRHDTHADFTAQALRAGKHVFVEKPLALDLEQLRRVAAAREATTGVLQVGFNRRFAPLFVRMREEFAGRQGPLCADYLVNAGAVPRASWIQDAEEGGGRVLGEVCHFLDAVRSLVGAPMATLAAECVRGAGDGVDGDKLSILVRFTDGSIATIHYWANGSKAFPKERLTAMADGRTAELLNFRELVLYGTATRRERSLRQDKGHRAEVAAFARAVRSGAPSPTPWAEVLEVTLASLAAVEAVRTGARQSLADWRSRLEGIAVAAAQPTGEVPQP